MSAPKAGVHKFCDNAGREWVVDVNYSSIKRVRDLTNGEVNLFAAVEAKAQLMQRLAYDPELLVNTVYCLCRPQADALGIDDVAFGEGMAGEAIDGATRALLDSLVRFFRHGQRALVEAAVAKMEKMEAIAVEKTLAYVDSKDFDSAVETMITAELKERSASAGNWPGSSASTPDP